MKKSWIVRLAVPGCLALALAGGAHAGAGGAATMAPASSQLGDVRSALEGAGSLDHPIFDTFYDIDHIEQVPSVRIVQGGPTWEQDTPTTRCSTRTSPTSWR